MPVCCWRTAFQQGASAMIQSSPLPLPSASRQILRCTSSERSDVVTMTRQEVHVRDDINGPPDILLICVHNLNGGLMPSQGFVKSVCMYLPILVQKWRAPLLQICP